MNLLFLGIFFAFGISLTSFQTLPAMELLRISQRSSEGIDPNLSYLPYKHLVNMFAPDYFGNQATGNFWSDGNYTNTAAYTGIITFVFASIAVIKRINRKKVKYFTAVFFLGLILTLKSPISEFTYMIKLIGSEAASTTRSLVLVNFALAGLFGIGIETLEKIKRKDLFVLIIPWTVLIGALLYSLFNEKPVGYRNLIFPGILLGFVTSLLVSLLKIKNNKYIKLSGVIVAILVVIELFRFGWKYTPFSPKEYIFPETDLTTYLQKDKLNRIHFGEVIPMNMWVSYGLPSLGSYDAVYPSIIAEYIAANNSSTAEATMMGRIATVDNSSGVLFDMAGINRLLSLSSEYDIYDSDYSKLFNDDKVYVYKNNSAIDRIKLYSNWKVIDDENKHLAYILDNNFDLEEEVIIFEDVNLSQSEDVSLAGDILAKEYESQEITIKVNTKRDALLFLSDTFYPGWEAYVDGEKEKIVRANYAFRAVPVRSGSKTVKFVYNPKSFKIGLWISGVTFIFLIAINVYSYKKTLI
ncbi:YfhO family protein [Candidatus Woesebacteria bacterium]|nr:YfhO family protein [Candidatus Woesebacteria bacterium]